MEPSPGTIEPAPSTGQPPEPPSGSQGIQPSPDRPSRKGSRNPLVLVVVAFVVALMLYFGYHQARRTG
ncbi:MAG: hypothetical protein WAN29_11365, partial [Candidatus Sulfotelmatobacter sp.]